MTMCGWAEECVQTCAGFDGVCADENWPYKKRVSCLQIISFMGYDQLIARLILYGSCSIRREVGNAVFVFVRSIHYRRRKVVSPSSARSLIAHEHGSISSMHREGSAAASRNIL
ncbi:unnamed protein product [Ceratitis capitata]|uniref:(Mediterranean fruit fly) hypothetical protein n=1 Tax=Ceratitis capitata TaxID=7213 RepID=A0A811UDE1_CERCA|nr:unnamed protein product [Ceratitis capitata]